MSINIRKGLFALKNIHFKRKIFILSFQSYQIYLMDIVIQQMTGAIQSMTGAIQSNDWSYTVK